MKIPVTIIIASQSWEVQHSADVVGSVVNHPRHLITLPANAVREEQEVAFLRAVLSVCAVTAGEDQAEVEIAARHHKRLSYLLHDFLERNSIQEATLVSPPTLLS